MNYVKILRGANLQNFNQNQWKTVSPFIKGAKLFPYFTNVFYVNRNSISFCLSEII
ncbi:conserved protein of unknown function [Citrobacter amalonaticus]|uniref:Uncharacterized protein n=1 Tax=Citrobacter amalonaticus TaxID=35703 RepID=A0AAX2BHV9_CITAM|nr:conserved protein of unknown function [Citrobacter amalonaticus]SBA04961.1 conserved protein of unknown function [Citrobacter amalonaticus]